jgi:hypothetical protein
VEVAQKVAMSMWSKRTPERKKMASPRRQLFASYIWRAHTPLQFMIRSTIDRLPNPLSVL